MPLIASRHPSSCHARACPYFNARCQSLPLCVCVCVRVYVCVFVCAFISFPFGFIACFDTLFDVSNYVHLPVTWHVCMICPHVGVSQCPVIPGWVCVMDCLGWDAVLLCVFCTGLAHIYKELPVFNPITFIPSTFLITGVEDRLRRINLHCFWCQRSWIPAKEVQI